MDFARLAVREVRRNPARTLAGILAVALATAASILARTVPQGYPKGFGDRERAFVGGDVLIWSAPPPVDPSSQEPLAWLPWSGQDWQSDILYFLPGLEHKGYLSASSEQVWRPITAGAVESALRSVSSVMSVRPYLTLPCLVETRHGSFQVILRGRGPEDDGGSGMGGFVTDGRDLGPGDQGQFAALVPLRGRAWEECDIDLEIPFSLVVPRLTAPSVLEDSSAFTAPAASAWATQAAPPFGLSWDDPVRLQVLPVGGYKVQIGETRVEEGQGGTDTPKPVMVPVYWERPEVVVTEETFLKIVSSALGSPAPSPSAYPVYQVSLKVLRMSDLKTQVDLIRSALGPGFAVYSVPELLKTKGTLVSVPLVSRDLGPVFIGLVFGLACVVVAGSVYILLSQQRRKIGLLRVIGATRRDIMAYALTVTLGVTLAGTMSGFVLGKLLSLSTVFFSDLRLAEYLRQTALELAFALGLTLAVSTTLGAAVGVWASRIPSAEVLRRE